MKQLVRMVAILIGASASALVLNSCDDDGDDSNECCDFTLNAGEYSISSEVCEDGSYTTTYDGETYSGSWESYYDSWNEVKEVYEAFGADCS